jgi:hypothetical protein
MLNVGGFTECRRTPVEYEAVRGVIDLADLLRLALSIVGLWEEFNPTEELEVLRVWGEACDF